MVELNVDGIDRGDKYRRGGGRRWPLLPPDFDLWLTFDFDDDGGKNGGEQVAR